ncbi:cyd operon YbgE family protein [Thauera linaloolentis]|uniref:Cyd operon protein YbgE n=1 Tax=Thauera linaloolentis (strain DSM 12138 / JCM 21573 / CCUG 41526 / CIP 105981 / IAM 15112 / NBRC 102519 / 47Lol) TaxID=1123367 RepID=N6Z657_THAL4|nr:cyd operon YbgE family protein [Thauera linaloolentis]ENO90022.1 hypothetical protein C666_03125 [Thauera linaloolentis 47Lol = DSM 12138]MCM8565305.1 cyd operon YbgE family protein [Thauera linaloolentis]
MDHSHSTQAAAPRQGRLNPLPLLAAITIMLGITAWPAALSGPQGEADHWAATALFWAMSAGFVTGVGFRPRRPLWCWLFSGSACLLGIGLAALRMALLHGAA